MFACPRPTVQNTLLIVLTIAVLFCLKDIILRYFKERDKNLDSWNKEFGEDSTGDFQNGANRELMLVQMLFRHGHRSPFMLYPNDPNSVLDWKEGMGMLTQIEMINSNNFRCQYAVYSFMAGLYAPTKAHSFTEEIAWQPIVSRAANWQGKNILTRGKCPIADAELKAFMRGKEARATKEKYKDLYNFWSKNSGRLIDNWMIATDLGKTLECEREYNLTIPEWALRYWDEFSMQTAINYYFNFGTKLIQKYKIGPLMGYMTEQIKNKILEKIPEKKVFIYSAHGSTIACLMLALDQYNWRGPPCAATVVLELWKEDLQDYSVRWLYFNSSNPEKKVDRPAVFRLEGCGGREFCPLGRFMDLIRWLVPENWEAECRDPSQVERFKPFEATDHVPALL